MQKKYVVRLTDQERNELREVVKKLKGTSQKVRRAQILLKADANGPNWTDERNADAFSCRTRTVEKIRQRLVERGFEDTLHGLERAQPPVEQLLTGEQEAAFEPQRARSLVRRIEFCYTPKHGSWLNIAENELSSLTPQCVSGQRFPDIEALRTETEAWSTDVNTTQRGVDWQMKISDARTKLKSVYPKIKLSQSTSPAAPPGRRERGQLNAAQQVALLDWLFASRKGLADGTDAVLSI